ncbi:MAG: hypothetical protein GY749_36720 [Desulfobacteraceae bacterium]|nr:hypothetical protein [Desulfobacteraceae bacterium]
MKLETRIISLIKIRLSENLWQLAEKQDAIANNPALCMKYNIRPFMSRVLI